MYHAPMVGITGNEKTRRLSERTNQNFGGAGNAKQAKIVVGE